MRQRVRRPQGAGRRLPHQPGAHRRRQRHVRLGRDPSRFSIACRQIGPISVDVAGLPGEESVYSARTSVFFKHTHVYRIVDKQRNTLVYLAISDKIIEGSPQNAISTVPIMPWGR